MRLGKDIVKNALILSGTSVYLRSRERISGAREGRGWPPLNKVGDGFPTFALSVLPVGHCMEGMYG